MTQQNLIVMKGKKDLMFVVFLSDNLPKPGPNSGISAGSSKPKPLSN